MIPMAHMVDLCLIAAGPSLLDCNTGPSIDVLLPELNGGTQVYNFQVFGSKVLILINFFDTHTLPTFGANTRTCPTQSRT